MGLAVGASLTTGDAPSTHTDAGRMRAVLARAMPWLLFAAIAILYCVTLYPGVGGRINAGDSAKWQFLWAIGGTPHSTGYPLYLMLSTLWGHVVTFVEAPLRISLLSSVTAVGALAVGYRLAGRLIASRGLRLLFVASVATSSLFWMQATEAEVYTLHLLFVFATFYGLLRYHESGARHWLLITLAVYAFGFGNHLSMLMFLPALAYGVLVSDWRVVLNWKIVLAGLGFAILGASQYLYLLYLSHGESSYLEYIGKDASVAHWVDYITGGQFRTNLEGASLGDMLGHALPDFLKHGMMNVAALFAIAVLCLLGWPLLRRRVTHPFAWGVLGLGFAGSTLYALYYRVADVQVYYIPPFAIAALLGVMATEQLLRANAFQSRWRRAVLWLIVGVTPTYSLVANWTELNAENTQGKEARYYMENLPEGSTLYAPDWQWHGYGFRLRLEYYEHYGLGRDVHYVTHDLPDQDMFIMPALYYPKLAVEPERLAQYEVTPYTLLERVVDVLLKHQGQGRFCLGPESANYAQIDQLLRGVLSQMPRCDVPVLQNTTDYAPEASLPLIALQIDAVGHSEPIRYLLYELEGLEDTALLKFRRVASIKDQGEGVE